MGAYSRVDAMDGSEKERADRAARSHRVGSGGRLQAAHRDSD